MNIVDGKIQIERVFTDKNQTTLYDAEYRDLSIKDGDNIIWEQKNVECPANWSDNACTIFASKYFRKKGVPEIVSENSIPLVIQRVVASWTKGAINNGYLDRHNAVSFFEEVFYCIFHQIASPNSPQWFNTGLFDAYGITGGDNDFYHWDPYKKESIPTGDSYSRTNANACYILSIDDCLISDGGILDLVKTEAKIFKFGSGAGSNWSKIRSKQEQLSGGGFGSGPIAFMEIADQNAKAIKSGGSVRRAALMRLLHWKHKDIKQFITWKVTEERKAKVLIAAGYNSRYDGEAYNTVSGQQSNNSVVVDNEFFGLLKDGDANVLEIWDLIAKSAWECGDPGLFFIDKVNEYHTCPHIDSINACNPCAEYLFVDNTACNLASINLDKFWDSKNNVFNYDHYNHVIDLFTLALEITISISHYPTKKIAENSYKGRTIGLGICNLGTLLIKMGLSYGGNKSLLQSGLLTSLLTSRAYLTSMLIADVVGACEWFDAGNFDKIIDKHIHKSSCLLTYFKLKNAEPLSYKSIYETQYLNWHKIKDKLRNGGKLRNMQVTCLAPTGTIGITMDCETTGIEPMFSLVSYKNIAGGGVQKYVNKTATDYLNIINLDDTTNLCHIENYGEIQSFVAYNDDHKKTKKLLKKAKKVLRTASCKIKPISPEKHIAITAALQNFVSGGISKTINCPESYSVEDIKNIYLIASESGMKGISIYRDNCKASQPLVTAENRHCGIGGCGEGNTALLDE